MDSRGRFCMIYDLYEYDTPFAALQERFHSSWVSCCTPAEQAVVYMLFLSLRTPLCSHVHVAIERHPNDHEISIASPFV